MPFEKHPVCKSPDEDSKIWRYMSFSKFISLLDKRALYFARVGELLDQDNYEGAAPKTFVQDNIDSLSITTRQIIRVNSWTLNSYETSEMWKAYVPDNEGVAIQSTYKRLKRSFQRAAHPIHIGEVDYISYEAVDIDSPDTEENVYKIALNKRYYFSNEREIRALYMPHDDDLAPTVGLGGSGSFILTSDDPAYAYDRQQLLEVSGYIPVDLDMLIEHICIAPTSPLWLTDIVHSITRLYNLDEELIIESEQ